MGALLMTRPRLGPPYAHELRRLLPENNRLRVVCRTCRDGRNPRSWPQSCELCGEQFVRDHKKEYPSHDIELMGKRKR